MAIKYNDLYMDLRRRLREAGAEDATQAARELVCTASGKTKNELLRDGLLYASPEVERSAYSLCARHLAGEPVAYRRVGVLRSGAGYFARRAHPAPRHRGAGADGRA